MATWIPPIALSRADALPVKGSTGVPFSQASMTWARAGPAIAGRTRIADRTRSVRAWRVKEDMAYSGADTMRGVVIGRSGTQVDRDQVGDAPGFRRPVHDLSLIHI